jgi:hypothetical protein
MLLYIFKTIHDQFIAPSLVPKAYSIKLTANRKGNDLNKVRREETQSTRQGLNMLRTKHIDYHCCHVKRQRVPPRLKSIHERNLTKCLNDKRFSQMTKYNLSITISSSQHAPNHNPTTTHQRPTRRTSQGQSEPTLANNISRKESLHRKGASSPGGL